MHSQVVHPDFPVPWTVLEQRISIDAVQHNGRRVRINESRDEQLKIQSITICGYLSERVTESGVPINTRAVGRRGLLEVYASMAMGELEMKVFVDELAQKYNLPPDKIYINAVQHLAPPS